MNMTGNTFYKKIKTPKNKIIERNKSVLLERNREKKAREKNNMSKTMNMTKNRFNNSKKDNIPTKIKKI